MMRLLLRYSLIVIATLLITIKYFTEIGMAYPFGWAPATEKNIAVDNGIPVGCTCHNPDATEATEVNVHTEIDVNIEAGKTYEFVAAVSSPSQLAAGINIAAFAGTLDTIVGEGLTVDNFDGTSLVHWQPKGMLNGKTAWRFRYTAPTDRTSDTIYATSNAVNGNGAVDNGDIWNHAPKYVVQITPQSSVAKPGMSSISVYPNPAAEVLKIESDQKLALITVTDALGKEQMQVTPSSSSMLLNVRVLTPGVYVVKMLASSGAVTTERVVIR
jgi:hypothetical protein